MDGIAPGVASSRVRAHIARVAPGPSAIPPGGFQASRALKVSNRSAVVVESPRP